MFTKKVVVSALLAVGMVGAVATPLASVAQVDIQLNWGPPTPRYEVIPVPRNGYIGSEGHWQWRGNRHVWIAGNWQAERPGYAWQPQWVERKGGRGWDYRASRWGRDGDGVPDRRDARLNDPTRRWTDAHSQLICALARRCGSVTFLKAPCAGQSVRNIACISVAIRLRGGLFWTQRRAVTRQITLPTSSATSNAPCLSSATPTGRPKAVPSALRNPVSTSTGAAPEGLPCAKGTKITL